MAKIEYELDAIQEILNIGVGRAAALLNEMLNAHVELDLPSIRIIKFEELPNELSVLRNEKISAVGLEFAGYVKGAAQLVFPPKSAAILVGLLTNEEVKPSDLNSFRISALKEVGNVLINNILGSLSNYLEKQLDYEIPEYYEGIFKDYFANKFYAADSISVLATTKFNVREKQITTDIIIIFELNSFESLKLLLKKTD